MTRVEKAAPLLALIRKHESDGAVEMQGVASSYDVVSSFIPKRHRPKRPLTTYPVVEILEWQSFVVANGAASSAAGAYQIIRKTLLSLKLPAGRRFDAACQDEAALVLLDRRGWAKCEAGKMKSLGFADALAREWASLPVQWDQQGANKWVTRGQSYYAGDSLNRASADPYEVVQAISEALALEEIDPVGGDTADRLTALETRVAALEAALQARSV